jgi:hypothetical protein
MQLNRVRLGGQTSEAIRLKAGRVALVKAIHKLFEGVSVPLVVFEFSHELKPILLEQIKGKENMDIKPEYIWNCSMCFSLDEQLTNIFFLLRRTDELVLTGNTVEALMKLTVDIHNLIWTHVCTECYDMVTPTIHRNRT